MKNIFAEDIMKKLISILLCAVMILSFSCASAAAGTDEGASDETSYYSLPYLMDKLFTDSREIASCSDFKTAVMKLGLSRIAASPDKTDFCFATLYVGFLFNIGADEDALNYDFVPLVEELGINTEYVTVSDIPYRVTEREDGSKDCFITVSLNQKFNDEFKPYLRITTLDYLYLLTSLYLSEGGNFTCDDGGVLTGINWNYVWDPTFKKDVNLDGAFNTKDLKYLKEYIALNHYSINPYAADVTKDGSINSKDVKQIREMIAGN